MSDYEDDEPNLAMGPSLTEVKAMVNDLMAASNSLGKLDTNDGTYMKDRDCKSCLKEIIRILNKDTRQHDARILLGKLDIIGSDLIPLMNQYCDYNDGDMDLFNLIMKLSTNITSSALLLFEHQEVPTDVDSIKVYNQLMTGLSKYKSAFANDSKIWSTLNTHLRHTEEEIPFERLLILIRNILHIPVDTSADQGIKCGMDAHEMCLYRMDKCGLYNTLIQVASETKRGTEFCFHVIEIVYLMLRDQNPATVANARPNATKRKLDDTDQDSQRLAELAAREKRERLVSQRRLPANPRFKSATFVIQNLNSIGNRPVITNHIVSSRESVTFDHLKTDLRKSKNRKPLSSEANSAVISDQNTRSSRVTYSLKVFSKMFVEKVYANYMQQIKHNLIQKKAAENDESYYLWSMQYFTAFNRHMCLSMDNISETMSTSSLHFIQVLMTGYQDKLKLEKKRTLTVKISKRLHLALRAYREILCLIKSVKEDSPFWRVIESIKKNILTELEYNTLLLTMFQQYDSSKHCREYLKDLIKTNDVFLEMMEDYTSTHGPIEMSSSDRDESDEEEAFLSGTAAAPAQGSQLADLPEVDKGVSLDQLRDDLFGSESPPPQLDSGAAAKEPTNNHGDASVESHDSEALASAPSSPVPSTGSQGVLAEASQSLAEASVDASLPLPPIDASLPLPPLEPLPSEVTGEGSPLASPVSEAAGDLSGDEPPAEEEGLQQKAKKKKKKKKKGKKKKDLRHVHFMSRYCTPDVIKSYLEVLLDFKVNETAVNLNILKFLQRIAHDCKCEVMLMQASMLRCLLDLHDYHASMPGHEGFVALTKHIMSSFGDMMHKKRWMVQELLFWKNHDDVVEIEMALDPPPLVARSPSPSADIDDGLGLAIGSDQDADDQQQQLNSPRPNSQQSPPVNSVEELMAELGSDSSSLSSFGDTGDDDEPDALSDIPTPSPPPQPLPAADDEPLPGTLESSDED